MMIAVKPKHVEANQKQNGALVGNVRISRSFTVHDMNNMKDKTGWINHWTIGHGENTVNKQCDNAKKEQ